DRHGRLVTRLTVSDFEVFDKGEGRRILDFQIDRTSPLTIALLVDVSGSMGVGPKVDFASQVAERLVANLEEGRDEVGLFTFDKDLHEPQAFTMHPIAIDAVLAGAQP